MKTLVVYYSRTGNTRRVARRIANGLEADVEEIEDTEDRDGVIGFLKGGKDSLFRNRTELGELTRMPVDYDLVLIGTPVWAGTACPAILTWLERFSKDLDDVAFFLTTRTTGREKTFTEMAEVSGATPHNTLVITASEIKSGEWIPPTEEFVEELLRWRERQQEQSDENKRG